MKYLRIVTIGIAVFAMAISLFGSAFAEREMMQIRKVILKKEE